MNVLGAMRDTLEAAQEIGFDDVTSDNPTLDFPHLRSMLKTAETGNFSYGKLCRWLGWMQAAVVAGSMGELTLDHMKEINRRHAD